MKTFLQIILLSGISGTLFSQEAESDVKSNKKRYSEGSEQLADEQDELSADVQQLVMEQTVPEVIELLSEVEDIMDETTDYLADYDTGGKTIAAQTEIIEKIHAAAKAKQDSGKGGGSGGEGGGSGGGAMMDMMERMMDEGEPGDKKEEGDGEGSQGGDGKTGDSDSENEGADGKAGKIVGDRTVPKVAGRAGKGLPSEFQDVLDAYNRGLEEVTK